MAGLKEYLVHIWGGAWNSDANPSIEKDLGIKEGYYYFQDEKERDAFLEKLRDPKYVKQGLMVAQEYGVMSHKRTIFVGTFRYQNKDYILHYDFGYDYDMDSAEFMFLNGNYACDCNRSLFIRNEYGDVIPELGCGSEIELVEWYFEYPNEERTNYYQCDVGPFSQGQDDTKGTDD